MTTPELLFQRLQELGAGEFVHLNGSLIEHLKGAADLLKSWGNREALCNAGLYHAVYGTDGYDESLVVLTMRQQIAGLIGTEAEGITYLYGACDRQAFYPRIGTSSQLTYSDRFTQKSFEIPHTTLNRSSSGVGAESDFRSGSLQRTSYARPGKLFTANAALIVSDVGMLRDEARDRIIDAVVTILRGQERA